MTPDKLTEILRLHAMWLRGEIGGERANLSGADLLDADLLDADLRSADLLDADLTRANLTRANLTRANLSGADLTRADLTRANLTRANLTRANLSSANLSSANLAGLTIPVVADLDAQILAHAEAGALDMSQWHCGTTHCRAGWACVLAGDAGAALESAVGASAAGALIYHASAGYVPDFYADDQTAIADMRARVAGTVTP